MKQVATAVCPQKRTDALVRVLAAEAFLVLFQAYMVAPLIPSLAESLHARVADLGLLIPAYTIPYGLSTLLYGPISDRFGRKRLLLILFSLLALNSLLVPLCRTVAQLIMLRIFAGLATGGIVPVSVSLIGDLFPYEKRGKPIGMLFGAMAGGMTFGGFGVICFTANCTSGSTGDHRVRALFADLAGCEPQNYYENATHYGTG